MKRKERRKSEERREKVLPTRAVNLVLQKPKFCVLLNLHEPNKNLAQQTGNCGSHAPKKRLSSPFSGRQQSNIWIITKVDCQLSGSEREKDREREREQELVLCLQAIYVSPEMQFLVVYQMEHFANYMRLCVDVCVIV